MMKKIAAAVAAVSSIGFASLSQAEAFDTAVGELDVSMTATLATDYIWRGQSQTDGAGAVQGSLDIAHESGLYIGAWASNIDGSEEGFDGASIEIDYYVGFGGAITDDISYDLQWATYTYPGNSSWDVDEIIGSLGFYGFNAGVKYAYEVDPEPLYYFLDYGFSLPYDMGLGLHYGYADANDSDADNYSDWGVSLGKSMLGLDLALLYSNTDIDGGCNGNCDSNLTFSVSKTL